MRRLALAAAVAAFMPLAPALSETVAGWKVVEQDEGCTAAQTFKDGTAFVLSYDSYTKRGLLFLSNPNWKSVEDKKEYPVSIEMPPFSAWSVRGRGTVLTETSGFYVPFTGIQFISEFMESEEIVLKTGRNKIGTFGLSGSYPAAIALAKCNRQSLERVKEDPFK